MKEVIFIGGINITSKPSGGEEAKNQQIVHYFDRSKIKYTYLDTHNWKKKVLKIILFFFKEILFAKNKKIILSVHHFSCFKLLKIFSLLKVFKKNEVHYFIIGGEFHLWLEENRKKIYLYKQINGIYPESTKMTSKLIEMGLDNVSHVPNFKYIPKIKYQRKYNPIKFVFLSRVSISKGTDLIIEAVNSLNKSKLNFEVDFYGKIDEGYRFINKIETINNVNYKGFLDLSVEDNYKTLSNYNCMLFPTFWQGEGYAGVLVDAMIANLPIIASDWNFNKEIVIHNYNGLVIAPQNTQELVKSMKIVIEDEVFLKKIELNSSKFIHNFDIEKNFKKILRN
jgi:glycosyltransferase involved in cell wall biosynthesis